MKKKVSNAHQTVKLINKSFKDYFSASTSTIQVLTTVLSSGVESVSSSFAHSNSAPEFSYVSCWDLDESQNDFGTHSERDGNSQAMNRIFSYNY